VSELGYPIPTVEEGLSPDVLRDRLAELSLGGVAAQLVREALGRVVSWSWTAQSYSGGERSEPFWRERNTLGHARVRETAGNAPIDQQPVPESLSADESIRKSKTFREFGRDSDGALVISRLVSDGPAWAWHLSRDPEGAEIWISQTESIVTSPTGTRVRSVRRTSWEDGRIIASASFELSDGAPWKAEQYSYRDSALETIRAWAMSAQDGRWTVWPHPVPMTYWTVERGGKKVRARPASASIPPQLSDEALDTLEEQYLTDAAAILADAAEIAWRNYTEWVAAQQHEASAGPVCFISVDASRGYLPAVHDLRILTVRERSEIRGRRTYRPLDAYLKPENIGVGYRDYTDRMSELRELANGVSDELHRRRDDQRVQRVVDELLARLQQQDWSMHFPVTDDLLVATIDIGATRQVRRSQLERSVGADRLAALEHAETEIVDAKKFLPLAIKLPRAEHALRAAIGTPRPTENVVRNLWAAFVRFLEIPIDGCEPATDGDLVLIEWNAYQDGVYLSFHRQLTPDGPRNDYTGMHRVHLQITLPREPELAQVADGNSWLRLTDPAFQTTAEALPAMQAAFAIGPVAWEINAGPV
jgi:hypothetical protein